MEPLPSRVRKRDGREESFDGVRLAESIAAALTAAGEDQGPASVLAAAVAGALAGSGAVETRDLAAGVESALEVSGHAAAAARYRAFGEERRARRGRLRVHTDGGPEGGARPWDRERLARSLVRSRRLEPGLAAQVARRIERRLLATGLRHATGRLVAALADNECRTLGLRADPLVAGDVGLDRGLLRAWLDGQALPAADGQPALAGPGCDGRAALGAEVLARFAREEILSGPQAQALADGLFDLPGLGDWLRPARRLLRPAEGETEEAFWRRVAGELAGAGEVQAWWPRGRPWSDLGRAAPRWLGAVEGRLRLRAEDPNLALEWALDGGWARLPLGCWLGAEEGLRRRLAATGRVLLEWWPAAAAPRRSEPRRDLAGLGVVDLLRAAAGSRGEERTFLRRAGEAASLAAAALRELGLRARGDSAGRAMLVPAGLPQALQLVLPGLELGSGRLRRLLLALRERFAAALRGAGFRPEFFAPAHPQGAGVRLARRHDEPDLRALPIGWNPVEAEPLPGPAAFAAAPWLEFGAAAALAASDLDRHLSGTRS
ncbi:MAG: hypothetical protein D6702_08650 [Planctomycetota bacterium]|nr:MAG: hypothetical protein D6702_08650 [Planctomycetota bacterium]